MGLQERKDVKDYLGQAAISYSDEQYATALAAEKSAQAKVCREPRDGESTDDLQEALMRRVARNLAMRRIPLGVQADDSGGMVIGSNDPEVRRLEKPWRKVFVG